MRYIFILLIISILFSCGFNPSKNTGANTMDQNDSIVDLEKLAQTKITTVDDYQRVLDRMDQGDLASLDVASSLFNTSTNDTLTRDSMFVVFNDFYNSVAGSYLENNVGVNSQLESSPSPDVINKLKSSLAAYGILLSSSEGTFYLEPQTAYLLQKFGKGLSPAYCEYLTIAGKEQRVRFAEDGTILIPADSLASRIMIWEKFMARYPDFISIKMAQDQYAQYLGAFLAGMDNSRVFDTVTNRLNDSSRVSFESFIVKYPESNSTEVVKAYLDLLKSSNFNHNDRVDSFLLEKVYH